MGVFLLIKGYFFFIFLVINGKIFGNFYGFIMNEGIMINWYLIGMGSEVDIYIIYYYVESFFFKVSIRNMFWGRFLINRFNVFLL